jgi:protein phosphatase
VTTIEVPDPSLVLLVGAAWAGKTTFAARHFAPDEVLSSDAYRALLSGDEANQKVSRVAFSILHRDLERRLRAGHLTIVDATNVEPRNRRELIRRAHAAGLPVVAFVLDLHPAVVLARNAARPRQVDEAVIRSQLERVRTTAGEGILAGEGCATVWIGRTPEAIDGVLIRRVPAAGAADPEDRATQPALSPTQSPRPR